MGEQVGQHLERFAAQRADPPGMAQLIALRVEGPLVKDVQHGGRPPAWVHGAPPTAARAAVTATAGGAAWACACVCASPPRGVDVWKGDQYSTHVADSKIPGWCQENSSLFPGLVRAAASIVFDTQHASAGARARVARGA